MWCVAFALGAIGFVLWQSFEPRRAERDLSAAPAAPTTTEDPAALQLVEADAARASAGKDEAPAPDSSAIQEHKPSVEVVTPVAVRGATLRGYVHDSDGAPVEGARVEAVAGDTDDVRRVATPSRADGSFELLDAPSGRVRVYAQLDDGRRSIDVVTLELERGATRGGIELVVPIYADPNAVLGLVLDVDGSPLAGARVSYLRFSASSQTSFGPQLTDERGRFRIQGRRDTSFRITAEHPSGAATAAHAEGVAPGDHNVVLRLTAARTVLLRVRSVGGTVLERFAYRVRVEEGFLVRYGATGELAHHAGGQVEFALPGSVFHVELSAPGHASIEFGPHDPIAVPSVLKATLEPLAALRGRVVRRGAPVAGAIVRAQADIAANRYVEVESFAQLAESCRACPEATSGADGEFVLDVGRAGDWWLHAQSGGDSSSLAGPLVVTGNGPLRELLLDVAPRGVLEGRVRYADGRPIAEREVRASRGDGELRATTTDALGAYRFTALAPGAWQVRLRGLDPQESSPMDVRYVREGAAPPIVWDCHVSDGVTTRFDVFVPEPARLVVSTAAAAAPFAGAAWRVRASRPDVTGGLQVYEARAGELPGEHVLDLPEGGEWTVSARTEAGGMILGLERKMTVPAGTSDFVWRVPNGALRGRLRPGFSPDARVELVSSLADGTAVRATIGVGAEGAFEFRFGITGKSTLGIEGEPARRIDVAVVAGQTVDAGEL